MIFGNKYFSVEFRDENFELKRVGKSRFVSVELTLLWFTLEIWCMDSAGYGGMEFRWNKYYKV